MGPLSLREAAVLVRPANAAAAAIDAHHGPGVEQKLEGRAPGVAPRRPAGAGRSGWLA